MVRRVLKATPSNTDEVHPFLKSLHADLHKMAEELAEQRTSFLAVAQTYQREVQNTAQALNHTALLYSKATGCTEDEANKKAESILAGESGEPKFVGIRDTAVPQWSYADDSMWRGTPDNRRVARLAKSILCSGFRPTSLLPRGRWT